MKCPKCQFDNPESAKFCNECGNKFGMLRLSRKKQKNLAPAWESLYAELQPSHYELPANNRVLPLSLSAPDKLEWLGGRTLIPVENKRFYGNGEYLTSN
jgi:hypothetical protein